MNVVAGPSPASNSLLNNKRKHSSSEDEETGGTSYGRKKYFYILEPASTSSELSDGPESIYSIQDKSTDRAKDTSDTCSKSEDNASNVEYEVVSFSETESFFYPFHDSTDSPEDLNRLSIEEDDNKEVKHTQSSCTNSPEESADTTSAYVFRPFYKNCLRCKEANSHPYFKYCLRCYRLRKEILPQRRKIKKKSQPVNRRPRFKDDLCDSGLGSSQGVSVTPDGTTGSSAIRHIQQSQQQQHSSDTDTSQNKCNICFVRPKDGAFCHGSIVHVYACYRCSVKVYHRSGRCPGCNNKARQVSRIVQL